MYMFMALILFLSLSCLSAAFHILEVSGTKQQQDVEKSSPHRAPRDHVITSSLRFQEALFECSKVMQRGGKSEENAIKCVSQYTS